MRELHVRHGDRMAVYSPVRRDPDLAAYASRAAATFAEQERAGTAAGKKVGNARTPLAATWVLCRLGTYDPIPIDEARAVLDTGAPLVVDLRDRADANV